MVDGPAGAPPQKDFVQSLDRGIAVIRALSAENKQLTLSEVARETGLSRAAARRFLLTLASLNYVGTDGHYFFLKPRVLELGNAFRRSFSVATIAQTHLESLAAKLEEDCSASVLDAGSIVYTSRAAANRIMSLNLTVGQRLPAFVTSMGRVLLASIPPAELDEYFKTYERPQLTPKTITSEKELRRVIDQVRKQGWAMIDQELEMGVRSIAVPVRDAAGQVVIAINSSAHASRVQLQELQSKVLPSLMRASKDIEIDLRLHH